MNTLTFISGLLPICLLAAGCATLPDAKGMVNEAQSAGPPAIETVKKELSPKRSRAIIKKIEKESGHMDILDQHAKLMEEISGAPLVTGNKATLLVDGPATYAAMFKAIGEARDSINLETFIFSDDETGRKFADMLLQKRAEGVQVNVIYHVELCEQHRTERRHTRPEGVEGGRP